MLPGTPITTDLDDDASTRLEQHESTPHQDPRSLLFQGHGDPDELAETFRHASWHQRRLRVARALARANASLRRRGAFASCGCQAWILRDATNPHNYKAIPDFCHDRWCVPCANGRAARVTANLLDHLQNRHVRFITLTLKASPDTLRARIDRLLSAFGKLRRRASWKDRVTGGAGFLEITRGREGGHWHPHLHLIVEGRYFPKQLLVDTWLELTGDSYVVDIKLIREPAIVARYVTKYASKPLDSKLLKEHAALVEAIDSLRGRKLLYAFGTWARWQLLAKPTLEGWILYGHVNELLYRSLMGDEVAHMILLVLQHSDDAFTGEIFTVDLDADPPPASG